jgi:hypothetical protein
MLLAVRQRQPLRKQQVERRRLQLLMLGRRRLLLRQGE